MSPNWCPCFLFPGQPGVHTAAGEKAHAPKADHALIGRIPTPERAREEGLPPTSLCPCLQPCSPATAPEPATLAPGRLPGPSSLRPSLHRPFPLPRTFARLQPPRGPAPRPLGTSYHLTMPSLPTCLTARLALPPHPGIRPLRRPGRVRAVPRGSAPGPSPRAQAAPKKRARQAAGEGEWRPRPLHGADTKAREGQEPGRAAARRARPGPHFPARAGPPPTAGARANPAARPLTSVAGAPGRILPPEVRGRAPPRVGALPPEDAEGRGRAGRGGARLQRSARLHGSRRRCGVSPVVFAWDTRAPSASLWRPVRVAVARAPGAAGK